MFTRYRIMGLALVLLLSMMLTACGSNDNASDDGNSDNKSSDEADQKTTDEVTSITIGQDPYDYAKLPVYLGKEILEENGYEVEVKVADVGIMFSALANGEVDIFPDVWEPNLHGSYVKKYKKELNLIGTLYKDAPMGVAVPKYMKDVNSIPDLKKYRDKFAGQLYGTEAGTGMNFTADKTIEAYNMDYEMIESSTKGMLAQVGHITQREEPIAFLAWHPHIMFKKYDIKLLDDPKGVWGFDSVKVGVKPDLKEKSPTAYTLFSNMNFTIDEVEDWLVTLRDTDKEVNEVAKDWIKEHPDRVQEWLNP